MVGFHNCRRLVGLTRDVLSFVDLWLGIRRSLHGNHRSSQVRLALTHEVWMNYHDLTSRPTPENHGECYQGRYPKPELGVGV